MRIAVIGTGNMGSWFARELCKDHEIAVYDKNPEKAKALKDVRILAELPELRDFRAEMLLNAVSLQHTVEAFESTKEYLPEDCLLCDVTSIKGELPAYYEKSKRRFVSIHPMFGPTFANMENLKKENCVIIKESDQKAANFFRYFFGRLGLKIFDYSFEEHDRMMAYSLTTPFAASLVFASCVDDTAVPGATFARHRNLAKGLLSEDDHLLAEILFNPESMPQLERIISRMEFLKHVIKGRDYDEAKRFFDKLRRNVE